MEPVLMLSFRILWLSVHHMQGELKQRRVSIAACHNGPKWLLSFQSLLVTFTQVYDKDTQQWKIGIWHPLVYLISCDPNFTVNPKKKAHFALSKFLAVRTLIA
jgi:hypothetical protein